MGAYKYHCLKMLGNIEERMGIKATVFHSYIIKRLKERTSFSSNIIKRKDASYIITRHISKDNLSNFLKEMENCGLIRQKDKQNIEIL